MIRVLFHLRGINLAGTETAVYNLIACLSKLNKYDIAVGYENDDVSEIMYKKLSRYASVIKITDSFETDILVYCFYSSVNGYNDVINKISRKKSILWQHFFGRDCILNNPLFCEDLERIICVSDSAKDFLVAYEPSCKPFVDKIDVVHNIINQEDIIAMSKQPMTLPLSNELNLVTISRVTHSKGFDRMLHVVEILEKRNINYKWYIIGGKSPNTPAINELIAKYDKYNSSVIFLGELENPYNILSKCDYLVLLSNSETWGFVVTEAKILNVPCLITNFQSAHEQIEDGVNGIILDLDIDISEYEKKLKNIIETKTVFKKNLSNFSYSNDNIVKYWDKLLSNDITIL